MTVFNSSEALTLVASDWCPPVEFDEFRIVRSLGVGAMGQVYLAHDRLLDRAVAMKFLLEATDATARARILDEARAIARLQHPNVVAIYRIAALDDHPYLVSEYVPGRALHQLDRPMPWRRVLDIALDLTRGLAAAHRRGVLHRDVKPANAILDDEGRAKLLDFGLAKRIDRSIPDDLATTQEIAVVDPAAPRADAAWTSAGFSAAHPQLVGTPMYMAPELWLGEPATRRSDLYSLGVVLYELLTGAAPHRDVPITLLSSVVPERDAAPVLEAAPAADPALAAIVDRLVRRDPAARFASADALLLALEERAAPVVPAGDADDNPYRGLAVYESAHAALFFGRRGEIRELVDRVLTEAFVVVGGDSGTGKSSLCRAGVLPWLARHDGWSCVEIVPGRHPVEALAAALAPWAGCDEAGLALLLRDSPDAVARGIRHQLLAAERANRARPGEAPTGDTARPPRSPQRLLVFVDQLEELLTLSEPDEARAVAAALAALAVRSPSLRVLATARSDFLSRLAMLPGLGDELARGLYFLRPLTGEHIREVIVRPAAARGVTFESDALVDSLVAQTEHAPGGLPLLQFTLAELWDTRDEDARTIRAASLTALGGVGGSLTRHADRLIAGLLADERDAARRLLLRLVTAQGTRTRRSEAELLGHGAERDAERTAERAALEALVHGRVVVANNAQDGAYEIAHEALLTSWPTLQGWLQRGAADRALLERVEQAATEWERMGRARDLLWGRRQLTEARSLDRAALPARDAAFLAASAAAVRRRRALGAGSAAVLVIGALIVGLAIRARARRELESVIAAQTDAAHAALGEARQIAVQRDVARKRAFGLFDTQRWTEGETEWTAVEAMESREEQLYRTALSHLDGALLLDPLRPGLRTWAADVTFERMVRAEQDRRADLADELTARLAAYHDDHHRGDLVAAAQLAIAVEPAGTAVWIERPGAPRQRVGESPLAPLHLAPGSLIVEFEARGRVAARLPILLERGETLGVRVELPALATAPRDMVYVPPGRFLFGSADVSELRREFYLAAPLHEITTAGYFIGRHEVTFAEWIEFLDELPPAERRRRAPGAMSGESKLTLTEVAPRRWRLAFTPTTRTYTAETGQRLHYEKRTRRADQDWTRFPVAAVSYDDATAFAAWLDRTQRMPGARLCDEYEWERAARGADARKFPGGATLAPDDANVDATYGREPLAFGPDEVGSHPASRSPVGADDMAGNVWEWTRSVEVAGRPMTRGGCWYQGELGARTINRAPTEPTQRHPFIGVRLCATPR